MGAGFPTWSIWAIYNTRPAAPNAVQPWTSAVGSCISISLLDAVDNTEAFSDNEPSQKVFRSVLEGNRREDWMWLKLNRIQDRRAARNGPPTLQIGGFPSSITTSMPSTHPSPAWRKPGTACCESIWISPFISRGVWRSQNRVPKRRPPAWTCWTSSTVRGAGIACRDQTYLATPR